MQGRPQQFPTGDENSGELTAAVRREEPFALPAAPSSLVVVCVASLLATSPESGHPQRKRGDDCRNEANECSKAPSDAAESNATRLVNECQYRSEEHTSELQS